MALRDVVRQRTAIADARGAAVAHQIEAQRIEIGPQAGFFNVVGDNFRSRRKTGFHPGLCSKTAFDGFLRQQAGAEHQRRIRGVGATGYRRDHHRSIGQIEFVAIILHADMLWRLR